MSNERERLAREWAESKLAMPTGHLDADVIAAAEHIMATTKEPTMDEVEWDEEKHALTGAVVDVGGGPVQVVMLAGSVDGIDYVTLDGKFGYEPRYYLTPNGKRYELREITEPEHPVEPSTKTMDEYSPEEQADMIGMWAEYRAGDVDSDFVIIEEGVNQAGRVPCYNPEAPEPSAWAPDPDELTPRFDLPRVWGKDGQPCEVTVSSNENVGADQPEHPEVLRTVEDYENAPEGTVVIDEDTLPWMKTNNGIWAREIATYLDRDMFATGPYRVLRWGKGRGE